MTWPLPRVIAHRCGGWLAPENTLAGLSAAAAAGCMAAEFDVMLCADNEPVLMHDTTLSRTTDGVGNVADFQYGELARLDAGVWFKPSFAGERIPTLAMALTRAAALGLALNIELKPTPERDWQTGEHAAKVMAQHWPSDAPPVLVSSFSEQALEGFATILPALPRALLARRRPRDWKSRCRRLEVVAMVLAAAHVEQRHVDGLHEAGLAIAAYSENDPRRAGALFELGIDGLITDRPDVIRAPLRPEPSA